MSMTGPIKIILRRESDPSRAIVDLAGPGGELASHGFALPWFDESEWQAVFRSLELQEEDPLTWPQGEVLDKAGELDLFLKEQNHPSNDRLAIIGQSLYRAAFCSEKSRQLLDRLIRIESAPVVEFHIQDEGSILQTYPWELLHDGEKFLFEGKLAFPVRHVDCAESITSLELTGALKVLYVAPRPNASSQWGFASLTVLERLHLEYLNRYYPDHLALDSLPTNTLESLQKYLVGSGDPVHIVHIDTHGGFGWLCRCKWLNPPGANQCSRSECCRSRTHEKNRGYLALETPARDIAWISGEELSKRLHKRGVQVVVLTACKSGLVGGGSSFNSVAGALVRGNIPAVVAMQFSIEVNQADRFAEFFYWALVNGMPLTEAVAEARIALSKDSWFRPVLYLRPDPSNYQGRVFEPKTPLGRLGKLTNREKWIAQLAFKPDPFLYTNGGTDLRLQEYFYFGMRHFYEIQGDPSKPETVFVFGRPGSGKSSLRNVISQWCRKEAIFPIVYQDFGLLVGQESEVKVEDHVTQLLKATLKTLAELAEELCKKDVSSQETEESIIIRNQLWLYVSTYEDDPLRRQALRDLLQPNSEKTAPLPADARELLRRICYYLTKLFEYKFVYVLVDPDEEIAWKVLEPLLSTRRILELTDGNVAFKFFLNQLYREQALQITWVKQEQTKRVYELEWPDEEVRALLQERLFQCSGGRYRRLEDLCEDVEDLDDRVVRLSMRSPRELIAVCDRLFGEHCRKWSTDNREPLLITIQEVERVLKPLEARYPKSLFEQLIAQGESERVEFKSTMRYNRKTCQSDKEMAREIARTMCAFMNTDGGTLIIGVADDGTVLGLDEDFSTLGRKNKDGFAQAFVDITENLFDTPVLSSYYDANFEEHNGKLVYIAKLKSCNEPVFCKFDGVHEFYVRKQASTRKLDVKATIEYCSDHFRT